MTEAVTKRASELAVGDEVMGDLLPLGVPGEVIYRRLFERNRSEWMFVAYVQRDGFHDSTTFLADAPIRVAAGEMPRVADPTGLDYTRADDEPDDPTPVSGARVQPHAGYPKSGIGEHGEHLQPAAPANERDLTSETPEAIDQDAQDAAAFDRGYMREHRRRLDRVTGVPLCEHDDDAAACQLAHPQSRETDHGLVDETGEWWACCGRADADEPHRTFCPYYVPPAQSPAEPVVRHFSFGHGQTDPATGQGLLDHYVTVIAPSAEACREAMFASRFGQAWAFDYEPDSPQWQEWGPRWTEHEVIDAMPKAES